MLWGHIQRSGKSYIMAGTIIENSKVCYDSSNNYLIITQAINETKDQYFDVLKCSQLKDFNIIHLTGENKNKKISGDKNIIICSKQFLQTKIGKQKIKWLCDMKFDIVFSDEIHYGGTTNLAQNIFKVYGKLAFMIQMTATYLKPVKDYAIPRNCWVLWDLEDIRLCKTINDQSKIRLSEKVLYAIFLQAIYSLTSNSASSNLITLLSPVLNSLRFGVIINHSSSLLSLLENFNLA